MTKRSSTPLCGPWQLRDQRLDRAQEVGLLMPEVVEVRPQGLMEEAQLPVVELDRLHGASLPPRGRFVLALARWADRDPLEACVARDRLACPFRVDPNSHALADLDLLSVDSQEPGAPDVDVHLFLIRLRLVVLEARRPRRQVEVVDAERGHAERSAHLLHDSVQLVPSSDVVLGHAPSCGFSPAYRPTRVAPTWPLAHSSSHSHSLRRGAEERETRTPRPSRRRPSPPPSPPLRPAPLRPSTSATSGASRLRDRSRRSRSTKPSSSPGRRRSRRQRGPASCRRASRCRTTTTSETRTRRRGLSASPTTRRSPPDDVRSAATGSRASSGPSSRPS